MARGPVSSKPGLHPPVSLTLTLLPPGGSVATLCHPVAPLGVFPLVPSPGQRTHPQPPSGRPAGGKRRSERPGRIWQAAGLGSERRWAARPGSGRGRSGEVGREAALGWRAGSRSGAARFGGAVAGRLLEVESIFPSVTTAALCLYRQPYGGGRGREPSGIGGLLGRGGCGEGPAGSCDGGPPGAWGVGGCVGAQAARAAVWGSTRLPAAVPLLLCETRAPALSLSFPVCPVGVCTAGRLRIWDADAVTREGSGCPAPFSRLLEASSASWSRLCWPSRIGGLRVFPSEVMETGLRADRLPGPEAGTQELVGSRTGLLGAGPVPRKRPVCSCLHMCTCPPGRVASM